MDQLTRFTRLGRRDESRERLAVLSRTPGGPVFEARLSVAAAEWELCFGRCTRDVERRLREGMLVLRGTRWGDDARLVLGEFVLRYDPEAALQIFGPLSGSSGRVRRTALVLMAAIEGGSSCPLGLTEELRLVWNLAASDLAGVATSLEAFRSLPEHLQRRYSPVPGLAGARLGLVQVREGEQPLVLQRSAATLSGVGWSLNLRRSPRRYALLEELAMAPRSPRRALYERVWGVPWRGADSKNALFASVSRTRSALRGKLALVARADGGYELGGNPEVWATPEPVVSPLVGGSEALERIASAAQTGSVWVEGIPGVGVTACLRAALPEAVYVDGAGCTTQGQLWRAMARAMGEAPGLARQAAARLLACTDRVVVIDHADDVVEVVRPLMEKPVRLVAAVHKGAVQDGALVVSPLVPSDAAALLRKHAQRRRRFLTPDEALELAGLCGCCPAALGIMGALLGEQRAASLMRRASGWSGSLERLVSWVVGRLGNLEQRLFRLATHEQGVLQPARLAEGLQCDLLDVLDGLEELVSVGLALEDEGGVRLIRQCVVHRPPARTPPVAEVSRAIRACRTAIGGPVEVERMLREHGEALLALDGRAAAEGLGVLARKYAEVGRTARALELWDRAIVDAPHGRLATMLLVESSGLLAAQGQLQEAEDRLERARPLAKALADSELMGWVEVAAAELAHRRGRLERALRLAGTELQEPEGEARRLRLRAMVQLELHELDRARRLARRAAELAPTPESSWVLALAELAVDSASAYAIASQVAADAAGVAHLVVAIAAAEAGLNEAAREALERADSTVVRRTLDARALAAIAHLIVDGTEGGVAEDLMGCALEDACSPMVRWVARFVEQDVRAPRLVLQQG